MHRRSPSGVLAWTFAPYIVASLTHVILLALSSPAAGPTKLILMPLLALPVLVSLRRTAPASVSALLLIAIVFSWLGDGAGAFFPDGPELPLMLLFFALAHLAYITLFVRLRRVARFPWWAAIYAVWWIGMMIGLGPYIGGLLIAVAVYGVILGGTAALATRCHPLIAAGGAFFLASDTVLALRLFLPDALPEWSSPAVMLTYTLGQGLIAAGILLSARKRAT